MGRAVSWMNYLIEYVDVTVILQGHKQKKQKGYHDSIQNMELNQT